MAHDLSAAYEKSAQKNHALLADVGQRFYALANTQSIMHFVKLIKMLLRQRMI